MYVVVVAAVAATYLSGFGSWIVQGSPGFPMLINEENPLKRN